MRRRQPAVSRILVVESGSRHLVENVAPKLRAQFGERVPVDLVTCYSGTPSGFSGESRVYRVGEYRGAAGRGKLYRILAAGDYSILAIICSDEPIMTKWKWMIAARVPAKVLIVNENADYFWFDRGNWRVIRHFVLFRAGLTGSGAVRTLGRLLLFPFTLTYLVLYASVVHIKRAWRVRIAPGGGS